MIGAPFIVLKFVIKELRRQRHIINWRPRTNLSVGVVVAQAIRRKVYEEYTEAHCGVKKKDAHTLWHLGPIAHRVLAHYENESVLSSRFEWPHWRAAARKFLPKPPTGATEDKAEAEDDEPAGEVAVLTKRREDLTAQVKASTQQFRNERAAKEELAEQLATERTLREQAERERDEWKRRYHAAVDRTEPEPAPSEAAPMADSSPTRQAVLQDIAKIMRGRIDNARIIGTADRLHVNGHDDDGLVFIIADLPAHPDITTEFALEIANQREAKEWRDMLKANGVTANRGHIVINETSRLREKATIKEPAWQATLGPDAKGDLIAACRDAKAIDRHKRVEVHAGNGKLSFGDSLFAFDRDALEWALRKNWQEFKVSAEGIIRLTVPGMVGDYIFYLRGYETGHSAEIERQRQIADIAELTDRANLHQIDDAFDNYWSDDLPPEPPVAPGPEPAPTIEEPRSEDLSLPEIVEGNRAAVLGAILDTVLPPGDRRQGAFFGAVEQVKAMGGIVDEHVLGHIRRGISDGPHRAAAIFAWDTTREILDRASIAMMNNYDTDPPPPRELNTGPAINVDTITLDTVLGDAELRHLTLQWVLKPFRGRAGPLDIVGYQRRCGFLKIAGTKLTRDQLVIVRKKPKGFWQEQGAAEHWLAGILSQPTQDDVPEESTNEREVKSEVGDGEPT
jgi:hypothetical protein